MCERMQEVVWPGFPSSVLLVPYEYYNTPYYAEYIYVRCCNYIHGSFSPFALMSAGCVQQGGCPN